MHLMVLEVWRITLSQLASNMLFTASIDKTTGKTIRFCIKTNGFTAFMGL